MTIIDLRKGNKTPLRTRQELKRDAVVERTVAAVIARVRKEGDVALREFTRKFDGAQITSFAVSEVQREQALRRADPRFIRILKQAAANIKAFHRKQLRSSFTLRGKDGVQLRQIYRPLERVGVYVPGGKAVYPSTVLMNVIPALVAGVGEIHLVSPPDQHGNVHPDVLLAASLLGVENVYRIGGAQAIAALAYGTESIPAVDKIVGPGNIYVATAKRMVYGKVGIDSIAGPSEVVVLADETAVPEYVASDLLAQAEHDERAVPILVTPSPALANAVSAAVETMLAQSPRRAILQRSLYGQGRFYITASLQHAIDVTNELAPEHLEIITKKDETVLKGIRHAGSIFLGNHSPVAIGDYFAGPNHVLPTEGTARFSSPLSVDDFMKRSSVIRYTAKRLQAVGEDVAYFAEREGLAAHALSLRLRRKGKP